MKSIVKAVATTAALACATQAFGLVTVYNDASVFDAATGAPIVVDFEGLSGDIDGTTVSGIGFASPSGNTLEVVAGASTVTNAGDFGGVIDASTNKLFPTSGRMVLSPGGVNLVPGPQTGQLDGLTLSFAGGISAFGLDILQQSDDCCSYVSYSVYSLSNVLLAAGGTAGSGGGGGDPGGSVFFGVYSDTDLIGRIEFAESDNDSQYPDANVGYDTFRMLAGPSVPEPATWGMMILGLGAAGGMMRRAKTRIRFA